MASRQHGGRTKNCADAAGGWRNCFARTSYSPSSNSKLTADSMPPKARCRRHMVRFMRNALSKTPPNHREWASAALKAGCAMESRESALASPGEMEGRRLGAAANCLREGIGETR